MSALVGRGCRCSRLPPGVKALAVIERGAAAEVIDVADREPGPTEARVAVEAASVNGFDLAVVGGRVWDAMPVDWPVVIGRDFAGTVESVGDDVSGLKVGDRVTGTIHAALGPGGIGEYVVQDVSTLAPVPAGVPLVHAAAVGLAGGAAIDVFDALEASAGDVVFVSGATGGVGLYLVQLLRGRGARVIATATAGEAEDVVRRLGATDVVDHTGDVAAQLRAVAPDGVDKVAHLAGDAADVATFVTAGGRIASLLGASNESVGRDDVSVVAIQARVGADKLSRLLSLVAAGDLEVVIAKTYPLDAAVDALAAFRTVPFGKVVVEVR
jgi:NADPH:quinone reductase-like Zn-dependent oxidoreductase